MPQDPRNMSNLNINVARWHDEVVAATVDGAVQTTLAGNANSNLVALGTDNATGDAFGRLRTSSPFTIFDSKQIADKQPLFWDDQETSGGGTSTTYNTNQASTTIAVDNLTAGTRVRQTFRHFNYQPGKSQLIFMTFVLGTRTTGITRRVGYFNTNNGLYLQQTSTGLAVVRRTFTSGGVSNNVVNQADWNMDTLDGNGPSGITLNEAMAQILIIDFEWLGVGRVRFGFNIDGVTIYVHEFDNANNLSLVYMSTPNLPLRYEISNDGTGAAAGLVHICSSVASEGGVEFTGFSLAVDRGITALATNNDTNIYPLIAIRLKSGYLGTTINITNLDIIVTTTADYRWALLLNPTIVGTALSFTSVTNSAIEAQVNTTNATTITAGTGTKLGSGYVSSTAISRPNVAPNLTGILTLGSSIAGTSDIIVLVVQNLAAGAESYYGSLSWKESV